jgi:hypothetical protein
MLFDFILSEKKWLDFEMDKNDWVSLPNNTSMLYQTFFLWAVLQLCEWNYAVKNKKYPIIKNVHMSNGDEASITVDMDQLCTYL